MHAEYSVSKKGPTPSNSSLPFTFVEISRNTLLRPMEKTFLGEVSVA